MKNLKILSAILTTALIITLSFASCGGGGGGGSGNTPADNSGGTGGSGGNKNPTSKIFESSDEKAIYILEVTSASAANASVSRAAVAPVYTPKTGDSFTLTIILMNGEGTWTDDGTVTTNGNTITLSGKKASELTITVSSGFKEMTRIEVPSGTTITIGSTQITSTNVEPNEVVEPTTINLYANRWDDGENWAYDILLSKIISFKPKKDDIFIFRISGTPNKTLEKTNLVMETHPADWSDFQSLGASAQVKLSGSEYFDRTFEFTLWEDPKPDYIIQLTLYNDVAPPKNVKTGDNVAKITDFELRLVGFSSK